MKIVDVSTIEDAEQFFEAFSAMKRAIVRTAWRIFSPLEVGAMQASLMRELSRGGPAGQAELARATANDPAATSRAVASLVDVGWVRRTPNVKDRRALRVEMTDDGKRAMKRIDAAYVALARALSTDLSDRDRSDFRRVALKVAQVDAPIEAPKRARALNKRTAAR
jgi:DNA-binding MarR family transcriptional regulator